MVIMGLQPPHVSEMPGQIRRFAGPVRGPKEKCLRITANSPSSCTNGRDVGPAYLTPPPGWEPFLSVLPG